MKEGRGLSDLAAEIERQYETKKDYIAPTNKLKLVPGVIIDKQPTAIGMDIGVHNGAALTIGEIAHDQISEHTKIPRAYYDRMRQQAPELLVNNIETWFAKFPAARMVRTLDGKARAFLSDKYSPMDNYDFANATLPILQQRKLKVMSAEITEKRLYIKAVDEQLFRDVPVGFKMGDGSHRIFSTCAPAIILSNSEVGFGRLVVDTGVYERACTNLCLFSKAGFKRTHVGARHQMTENLSVTDLDEVMSSDTKRKTMEALWLQVRDVIAAAFDEKVVAKRAEAYEAAAGRKIEGKVDKVMEVFADRFALNENEKDSVLKHLIAGGNLNQYGLHAAVTRAAQDVDSYDRATELEYLGGRVVELPRTEWEVLAQAA